MSETARDPRQPADFDPIGLGRQLLRSIRVGALATIDGAGRPLATLVSVATDIDGAPLLLISDLSNHTRALRAHPLCSLLLAQGGKGDPLAHPRLSLVAEAEETGDEQARRRFLARHPKAALYAGFGDFHFFRLAPQTMHLNGGFARAHDGPAAAILSDLSDAAELVEREAEAVEHMNADHADALALYAEVLCGQPAARWLASGLDPDGLDLMAGDRTARLSFPRRVRTGRELRALLKELADFARASRQTQG